MMTLPDKQWLTIPELKERWNCTRNDLMHYGCENKLDFYLVARNYWVGELNTSVIPWNSVHQRFEPTEEHYGLTSDQESVCTLLYKSIHQIIFMKIRPAMLFDMAWADIFSMYTPGITAFLKNEIVFKYPEDIGTPNEPFMLLGQFTDNELKQFHNHEERIRIVAKGSEYFYNDPTGGHYGPDFESFRKLDNKIVAPLNSVLNFESENDINQTATQPKTLQTDDWVPIARDIATRILMNEPTIKQRPLAQIIETEMDGMPEVASPQYETIRKAALVAGGWYTETKKTIKRR